MFEIVYNFDGRQQCKQKIMETYKVVIEIPKGNVNNKYEYDEVSKEFKLDFVFENIVWPYNYGFFPGTLGGDGDTLDALVLSSAPLKQGQEVEVKIIGAIDVLDRGEEDFKIVCLPLHQMVQGVPSSDALSPSANDISDIPEAQLKEWGGFFMELARQKKKVTKIKGFLGKEEASILVKKSFK